MQQTQKRDEQNNYYVCLSIIIYYKGVCKDYGVFRSFFVVLNHRISSETFLIWNYGATLMALAEFSPGQLFDQVNHL